MNTPFATACLAATTAPNGWGDLLELIGALVNWLLFSAGIVAAGLLLGIVGMVLAGLAPRWTLCSVLVVIILCALVCGTVALLLRRNPLAG